MASEQIQQVSAKPRIYAHQADSEIATPSPSRCRASNIPSSGMLQDLREIPIKLTLPKNVKQVPDLFMLKAIPWLVLGWILTFVTLSLVFAGSGGKFASALMWLMAAPAVLLLGAGAFARWLLLKMQGTAVWQRMTLGSGIWQTTLHVVAWIVVTLVGGAVAFMNLIMLICFDNFRGSNSLHLLILSTTGASLVVATMAFVFLTCRNGCSYLLLLSFVGFAGATLWLWSLPGAKGLIH